MRFYMVFHYLRSLITSLALLVCMPWISFFIPGVRCWLCLNKTCVQPNLGWSCKLISIDLIGIFLLEIGCIWGFNLINSILWGLRGLTSYSLVILVPSKFNKSLVRLHISCLYLRVALSNLFFMFHVLRASLILTLFPFQPFHLWILKDYYSLNLLLSCSKGLNS